MSRTLPYKCLLVWGKMGGMRALFKVMQGSGSYKKNSWVDTTPLYNPRKLRLRRDSLTRGLTEDLLKSLWPTYLEPLIDVSVSLEEELYLKEISAVGMFGYFAFLLLNAGKPYWPIIKLLISVNQFRQRNYFSKLCKYYLGLNSGLKINWVITF